MLLIPWLMSNSDWFVPAMGWLYSEYLGWKSGGQKASVSQIIWDSFKELIVILKELFGEK